MNDDTKDVKKMIAWSFGGLIGFILFLYALTAQPVFECSTEQEPLVAETVQACLKEETAKIEIESNAKIAKNQLELDATIEKNRHCEAMLSAGGKLCLKELESIRLERIQDHKVDCSLVAKQALCKPKMFLWKFWVLPGKG